MLAVDDPVPVYGMSNTVSYLVLTTSNPPQERAIELGFDENDTLFMITDIRGVYKLPLEGIKSSSSGWAKLSLWEKTQASLAISSSFVTGSRIPASFCARSSSTGR